MKNALVLVLLCVTYCVNSMDQRAAHVTEPVAINVQPSIDRYLWFMLSSDKKIVEYACKNMEFFCPPKDFLNQSMLEVVPLSDSDKEAIKGAMHTARKNRQEQAVSYGLEGMKFNAAIKYRSKYEQYRMKVTKQ